MATTKDEFDELDEFIAENKRQQASTGEKALLVLSSLFTAAIPVYLYHSILDMTVQTNAIIFGVAVLLIAGVLNLAHQNVSQSEKRKLLTARDNVVTHKSVQQEAASKKEKPSELLKQKKAQLEDLCSREAVSYTLFYNNASFLIFSGLTFLVLRRYTPEINYLVSSAISAGIVVLSSTSSK